MFGSPRVPGAAPEAGPILAALPCTAHSRPCLSRLTEELPCPVPCRTPPQSYSCRISSRPLPCSLSPLVLHFPLIYTILFLPMKQTPQKAGGMLRPWQVLCPGYLLLPALLAKAFLCPGSHLFLVPVGMMGLAQPALQICPIQLVILVNWPQRLALRMAHSQILGFCWKNQKKKKPFCPLGH